MTRRTVGGVLTMLPRNVIIVLLRGYRAAVSPLYGQVCRYYPSCSAYALEAVQQHGVIVGSGLSAWRVLRCNPWARGGIDDVPERRAGRRSTTSFGFVCACADDESHAHLSEGTSLRHA